MTNNNEILFPKVVGAVDGVGHSVNCKHAQMKTCWILGESQQSTGFATIQTLRRYRRKIK